MPHKHKRSWKQNERIEKQQTSFQQLLQKLINNTTLALRRPKIHLSTQKKHIIRLKQNHITACHLLIQALIDDRCGSFASTSSKTGKLTRFRTSEKQHKSVMKKMTHVEGHRVRKSCGADTALHRHATKGDPLRRSSSARDRESEREREFRHRDGHGSGHPLSSPFHEAPTVRTFSQPSPLVPLLNSCGFTSCIHTIAGCFLLAAFLLPPPAILNHATGCNEWNDSNWIDTKTE